MELAFHSDALAEFKAEVSYYEAIQPSLGLAFADEVFRMIDLARLFPRMGSPEEAEVRSLLTKRFSVCDLLRTHRRNALDLGRDARHARARLL